MRLPTPWQAPLAGDPEEEEERTAAGIYGLIVSAAVLASAHIPSSARLIIVVLVTLIVYWAAERYAIIMAGRLVAGRKLSRAELRRKFSEGWGLVTTSFLPLVVLVAADLLGADMKAAVITALVGSTALLFLTGWRMGADGRLSLAERLVSASAASLFGVALIALKVASH